MKFVNSWITTLSAGLAVGGTQLPVDQAMLDLLELDDDIYVLTITDSADLLAARATEIVHLTASGLVRAQEGTQARDWPSGSIVFAGITAGVLQSLRGASPPWQALTPIAGFDGEARYRLFDDRVDVWFDLFALQDMGWPEPLQLPSEADPASFLFSVFLGSYLDSGGVSSPLFITVTGGGAIQLMVPDKEVAAGGYVVGTFSIFRNTP